MDSRGLFLVSIALWSFMCSAAPQVEFSGDTGLQQFVWKSTQFVSEIKTYIISLNEFLHQAFSLGDDRELLMIQKILGIEQVDASRCREDPCDMEGCFNQILAGLQTYNSYLSHIKQILSNSADRVARIQQDISNLSDNIQKQMKESSLTSIVYPQAENEPNFVQVQREIGSYLVLRNLQKFMDVIYRAVRHCGS